MARRPQPTKRAPSGPPARLKRLRRALDEAELSHLLVTNPTDVGYLTGFLGGDSYLLIPTSGRRKPVLVSDARYAEELEPLAPLVRVHIRSGSMLDAIRTVVDDQPEASRIGLQSEHVTVQTRKAIAKRLGAKRLADTAGVVSTLRMIKDGGEVALIKKAVRLQEAALLATLETIEPGQREEEVAATLEYEMKRRGSVVPGFTSIVAAGANASLPHYRPGRAKVPSRGVLLIDWGATVDGYRSDMTRTFHLGSRNGAWSRKMDEVYDIVLEAHERSAGALCPGADCAEVDAVARDCIAEAGYGDRFGHSLGHGIGMDVHEGPGLSRMMRGKTLEPGMVVTIEPGIYLPGVGGVRIEDDYLITARGARSLCTLPKDRSWATR